MILSLDMNEIIRAVKRAAVDAVEAQKPCIVLFGTVTKENPLEILVEQKMTLSEAQLILSRNVTDFQTEISFDDPDIKQPYTTWDMGESTESTPRKIAFKEKTKHKITVYNALKIGEKVILLRCAGGQSFVVLDRVGGG